MRHALWVLPAALIVAACADDPRLAPLPVDDTVDAGGDATGGTPSEGGSGGTMVPEPEPSYVATISGDAVWNVTFDAEALAAGATDCAYTRHYDGVEDASAPWRCPTCEIMFRAQVEMTAGAVGCYDQVSSATPAAEEWIGYGNGSWWRAQRGPLTEQGTVMDGASAVAWENFVPDVVVTAGGTLTFNVLGDFTLGQAEGDPLQGFHVPERYACGWPKADPPPYSGDYVLAVGETVPDGWLDDKCEETVRLHDFKGAYLLIDMSAIDCPPCQAMAANEEQFVSSMAAQGIEVHVITLLAPSLADVTGETTPFMLNNWTDTYGLSSPVLADRAWGLAIFMPAIPDAGYPSWVLVDPDLKVIDFDTGFATFASYETAILAHAMSN
jgi:hypothetical protein